MILSTPVPPEKQIPQSCYESYKAHGSNFLADPSTALALSYNFLDFFHIKRKSNNLILSSKANFPSTPHRIAGQTGHASHTKLSSERITQDLVYVCYEIFVSFRTNYYHNFRTTSQMEQGFKKYNHGNKDKKFPYLK